MKLRKGINLVLVPTKEEATECYGLGDNYLDEIYSNIFGDKPRHYLDKLDFRDIDEQVEIIELLQKLENNDSIIYTYIDDIYKLLENGSNFNSMMKRLSNNIIIIFIKNIAFDVESFKILIDNIFKTHKLYNKFTEIYSVRVEVLRNDKIKMKMDMDRFRYNNSIAYVQYIQSANLGDIFSINKYYCKAYIETKDESFEVTSFIQAVTTEDARCIFIDYITKYNEIPLEAIKNIYINKISTDNLLNRNKLTEMIANKPKS